MKQGLRVLTKIFSDYTYSLGTSSYCNIYSFTWAEYMIEEVVCPSRTSLSFDLSFFDMLLRKEKVNTFGIKEDVRDVLLFLQVF